MDIGKHRIWEVIIDDKIDIGEVYSSGKDVSRYKDPILACIKFSDDLLPFLPGFVGRKHFDSLALMQLLFEVLVQLKV